MAPEPELKSGPFQRGAPMICCCAPSNAARSQTRLANRSYQNLVKTEKLHRRVGRVHRTLMQPATLRLTNRYEYGAGGEHRERRGGRVL